MTWAGGLAARASFAGNDVGAFAGADPRAAVDDQTRDGKDGHEGGRHPRRNGPFLISDGSVARERWIHRAPGHGPPPTTSRLGSMGLTARSERVRVPGAPGRPRSAMATTQSMLVGDDLAGTPRAAGPNPATSNRTRCTLAVDRLRGQCGPAQLGGGGRGRRQCEPEMRPGPALPATVVTVFGDPPASTISEMISGVSGGGDRHLRLSPSPGPG